MSYLGVRKVARPQAKSSQTCGPPPPPRPPHPDPSWTIGIEIWFVLWFILVCTIHYALFHLYLSHHSKRYIQSGIGSSENLPKKNIHGWPHVRFQGCFSCGFSKNRRTTEQPEPVVSPWKNDKLTWIINWSPTITAENHILGWKFSTSMIAWYPIYIPIISPAPRKIDKLPSRMLVRSFKWCFRHNFIYPLVN